MAKAQRGAPTQKKKKEQGVPFKFRDVMEEREKRSESDKPRLVTRSETPVRAALVQAFGYRNPLEVPRLQKIVLNIGLGEALKTPELLEQACEALGFIAGQRPVVTR